MKKPRKHWYFIYTNYCPVCGRERVFRERRYDKRPKRWEARHRVEEVYDYCDELGSL